MTEMNLQELDRLSKEFRTKIYLGQPAILMVLAAVIGGTALFAICFSWLKNGSVDVDILFIMSVYIVIALLIFAWVWFLCGSPVSADELGRLEDKIDLLKDSGIVVPKLKQAKVLTEWQLSNWYLKAYLEIEQRKKPLLVAETRRVAIEIEKHNSGTGQTGG